MYIKVSWDQEFDNLMMHLISKYGREIFTENGIGDQLDLNKFSKNFFNNTTTTADISVDANSNVSGKTIIDYSFEFSKPLQRYNSHYLLWKELKKNYNLAYANEIIEKQISGEIYINDFSNFNISYCFNFSTYDIALNGLEMSRRLKITRPKSLESFIRQMEQFTVYAANSTSGATGLADILIVASYYVDRIIETGYDGHIRVDESGKLSDRIKEYVSERLASFIYTLNWSFRGNQCNCEQTQVLTPDGWKGIDDLKVDDPIYTWEDGKINIEPTQSVNIYDYDGEMHHYSGKCVDQLVTPNHMVVYNRGKKWRIDQSKNLIDSKSNFHIPTCGNLEKDDYPIEDSMIEMIAFILTDGSFDSQNDASKRIKWCKTNKRWGITRFKELCENLNYDYHHRIDNNHNHPLNVFTINVEQSKRLYELCPDGKQTLPEFFKEFSPRQAKIVLDTWEKLDGYDKRHILQCDTKEIAEGLQHLCLIAGETSFTRLEFKRENQKKTLYVQRSFHKTKTVTKKEKVQYKGRVWCPTTETGVIIAKRNGKVFITGNSPFTNISIYDKYFLESLVDGYKFHDGKTPEMETIKKTQEMFLECMNKELKRTNLTFPVVTACFNTEFGELRDFEFLDYIADQNLEFGFINIYYGKSSTISGCCFDKEQMILTRSINGVKHMSFEDLYNSLYYESRQNLTVFHNGSWCKCNKGKPIKILRNSDMYKITTTNKKEFILTGNHINVTDNGEKTTDNLTTNDFLAFNTRELNSIRDKNENLTYEQGYLIGAYLGDGSKYKRKDVESYSIVFSLGFKNKKHIHILKKALDHWNIDKTIHTHETKYNVLSVVIYSKELFDIINKYVIGNYSHEKDLNLDVLEQSVTFRKGIIDGWYMTDGGNSNRIYSTSKKLIESGECLFSSIGKNTIIDISEKTNEKVIIRGSEYKKNYPLYCIRWYDMRNNRSMKDICKVVHNTEFFRIKNIEKITPTQEHDYVYCFEMKKEPYFTLPSGLITHNCRLRSEMVVEYHNSFGAGSTKIGSLGVVTVNFPRIAYKAMKTDNPEEYFIDELKKFVSICARINHAKRKIIKKKIELNAMPLYTLGYMDLKKQYSTYGVTGLNEALEILGYDIVSTEGELFVLHILDIINIENDKMNTRFKYPHNCEQVPAESCFLGNTIVKTVTYGDVPIKDLVGKEFLIYSFDKKTMKTVIKKAKNVRFATNEKFIYRVHFDNGTYVDCTDNEKFAKNIILKNKKHFITWVRCDELQEKDSIRVMNKRVNDQGRIYFDGIEESKLVYNHYNGKIQNGYVIHHKDRNKSNNDISNLECMLEYDHKSLHSTDNFHPKNHSLNCTCMGCKIKRGELIGENNPMYGKTFTNEHKRKISEKLCGRTFSEDHKKNLSIHAKNRLPEQTSNFNHEIKTDEILDLYYGGLTIKEISKKLNCSYSTVHGRVIKHGLNHKVVKVENLGYKADTFDIEVEDTHCFFVGDGVLAHNSSPKLAKRDRMLKYQDEYEVYSNQFIPLTTNIDMIERLKIQGSFDSKFSGGSICHINIDKRIKNVDTLKDLMIYASKTGTIYWAVNYVIKRCVDAHAWIDGDICPVCGKKSETATTRVVGYFSNIENFNKVRRELEFPKRIFYDAENSWR
jgi:anaerobic ribonucleoside-triphosphate reductase